MKEENGYFLFDSAPTVTRLMHYPAAISHCRLVASDLGSTIIRTIDQDFKLNSGTFYVTVPFELPEGIDLGDLRSGKFFVRTAESKYDPRRVADVNLTQEVNERIVSLVLSGSFNFVTEYGPATEGQIKLPGVPSQARIVEGRAYASVSSADSEPDVRAVVYDPCVLCGMLIPPTSSAPTSLDQLQLACKSVVMLSIPAFDYDGLLVWFPQNA